mgnify:CR=1 FL=1|tara:strand:- start:275 stop:883 length:609 start_codon:yes stop_codon:yes gene_type:complete
MKKFTIALVLSLTSLGFLAQNKLAVKITPITFHKKMIIMAHAEYNFAGNFTGSIGLAPIFYAPLAASLEFPVVDMNSGISIDPEIRWYAKSDGVMDGFFIGLYNSTRFTSWETYDYWYDGYIFGIGSSNVDEVYKAKNTKTIYGFELGVQKLMGDHFSVDFYAGLGVQSNRTVAKGETTGNVQTQDWGGINGRLNVSFGWQF